MALWYYKIEIKHNKITFFKPRAFLLPPVLHSNTPTKLKLLETILSSYLMPVGVT